MGLSASSSRGLLPTLFSRLFQLMNLLLRPSQHVLRRDGAGGAVQTDVRLDVTLQAGAISWLQLTLYMMLRCNALLFCCSVLVAVAAAEQPTITFSTFLGVADCDGIAVWHGDAFLACHSPESLFPSDLQGPKPVPNVMSAYVLRLNLKKGKLVYAACVGGGDFTGAFRIKIDERGFAYVVGFTKTHAFPTTPDAVQRQFGGGDSDAFLVKVTPSGQIVYATLLGGSGADQGNALELDGKGGVFVGGTTWSSDFPGMPASRSGDRGDAFVSYLRPGDRSSLRSVVFGGTQEEKLTGLAADGRGGLFAVGYTKSKDFPTVSPIQSELRGVSDLFLTRLRISDLAFTFSTFFGGSGDDSGWGVAVDKMGKPVVAGITDSTDLPASNDAFQRTARGGLDTFVAKFEGPGYGAVSLTYFGGTKDDSSGYDGDDIKLDSDGNVWLAGLTASPDLPTRRATQPVYGGGETDGFLAVFSPNLTHLCYATYRGGSDRDILEGLDLSPDGEALVTGLTFSKDLPMPARRTIQRRLSDVRVGARVVNATVFAIRDPAPCR